MHAYRERAVVNGVIYQFIMHKGFLFIFFLLLARLAMAQSREGYLLVDPPKNGEPFSVINWGKAQIRAEVDKYGGVKDSKYKKTGSIGVRG